MRFPSSIAVAVLSVLPSLVPSLSVEKERQASVEVQTSRLPGSVVYLVTDAYLDFNGTIIDSTRLDAEGTARFKFTPNPAAAYSFFCASVQIAGGLCFAARDSVILREILDSSKLRVIFDAIGANAFQLQIPFSDSLFGKLLNDTSCSSWGKFESYNERKGKQLIDLSEEFAQRFPEHTYYQALDRALALGSYSNNIVTYVWNRERFLPKACRGYAPEWIDTVMPLLHFPSNVNPWPLLDWTMKVMEVRVRHWYKAGVDTSGAKESDPYLFRQQLHIALQWKELARDVALFEIIRKANLNSPLDFSIQIAQEAYDSVRALHGDVRVLSNIHAKLKGMKERLAGTLALNFTLIDSNTVLRSLRDYEGKAVLIHFWGTWCGPCLQELPSLDSFRRAREADTGIVFISVALEAPNTFEKWKTFLRKHNMSDIELFCDLPFSDDPARPYDFQFVQWVPSYVLIDRQGHLVSADEYPPPNAQLENDIKLAEQLE